MKFHLLDLILFPSTRRAWRNERARERRIYRSGRVEGVDAV